MVECDVPHNLTYLKEHLGPSHVWCLAGGSGLHEGEVSHPCPIVSISCPESRYSLASSIIILLQPGLSCCDGFCPLKL